MNWKAVSHSSIGVLHQQNGLPCQDYGNYRPLKNGVIIGAVADGAGSAKYSDVGARLVVETTLVYLMGRFIQKQRFCQQNFSKEEAKECFDKLLKSRLIGRLKQKAQQEGYSIQDLACTLLCFVATPSWTAAMQIGDGFLVVQPQNENYKLLFSPDKGEFTNETTFVTSANALSDMQVGVIPSPLKFICAATDGLERVALRMSDWTPFAPFFNPLNEYLEETPKPYQDKAYLVDFLASERLNQKTQDDKTLLLCLYQN
jgi:serine/threonine protein phosphatase PrpC